MLVVPVVAWPLPAWQEQTGRQLKPVGAPAPIASHNQPDDDVDPEPPPSAPAMRPWPRVFPGL